jgi:Flp pilus assembly protein TadD
MRPFRAIVLACASLTFAAQGPLLGATQDDLYLDIYRVIQDADALQAGGRADAARAKFQEAQNALKKLQTSSPNFNPTAVNYRLEYVNHKLESLPSPPSAGGQTNSTAAASAQLPAKPEDQVKFLNQELAQLRTQNMALQEKLKEALSAQPAAVDPQKLQEAEERANALAKQRELLNVELEQLKAKQPDAAGTALLEQTKAELASANKRLTEAVANVASLSQARQTLQNQLDALGKQLEEAKAAAAKPQTPAPDAAATQQVAALQQQIASLTEENKRLAASASPADEKSGEIRDRMKKAEKERDEALKNLNDVKKELYDIKARGQLAQLSQLTNQVNNLRARLEVFEARKAPYTPEEMALMSKQASLKSEEETKAAKKPIAELPRGAANLVAEAQAAFTKRDFKTAEEKYQQVLAMDQKNPVTLAGLAAIQVEMGKNQEAEENLKHALELYPDSAYSLSLLGLAKFNQEKYQEALDALSRSAQLDPKNPETQNYLGITLGQLGQRDAAEAALRKAIQLNPGYSSAHQNLAVIYATQKPPMIEMARFHYNKALAGGHPKNETLEKILNGGAARQP